MTLLLGFILALAIAMTAYRKKSLNRSGALAALLMGTIIFGLGGLSWAVILLVFFVSSSLLSHWKKAAKLVFEEKFSKSAQRDAAQVFANGGLAMLLVIVNYLQPDNNWVWLAFAVSLAAANADTWATELGVLAKKHPRLITTGKSAEPGTSGAISIHGLLASCAGAAVVALPALLLWQGTLPPAGVAGNLFIFLVITLSGLTASLTDSLLGATVQAIYYCPQCQKETERHPLHSCQTATLPRRGWRWLDNDWVNFSATASGVLVAMLLGLLLSQSTWFSLSGKLSTKAISLSSPGFAQGDLIPLIHTCQGENQAPELQWSQLPENTQAVLLVMQDTDTPMGRITHWLVTAPIVSTKSGTSITVPWILGASIAPKGGYTGPCPPPDPAHRYYFHLYALSQPLQLNEGFTWQDAVAKMQGLVVGEGQLMGKYQKQ